jgi:tricorn protease
LWISSSQGGDARRLTVHDAYDAYPSWSPDGRWIGFSSRRMGNYDLFIIPARGGDVRQLTFHSSDDILQDWSPDGKELMFSATRESRYPSLYSLRILDGKLKRLTFDDTPTQYATYSPDGTKIAYTRGGQRAWRPKYRGSQQSDVWTLDLKAGKHTRWTTYDGWDAWPVFLDDKRLEYVSYQNGQSNLYEQDTPTAKATARTKHEDDSVRTPSISRDRKWIAYEEGFGLWIAPTSGSGQPRKVDIYASSDIKENVLSSGSLTAGASGIAASPDGKLVAFAARGEIWTVPVAGGDAVRMTTNPADESNPVWSPDSKRLAYVSDRDGSLDVYVMDATTKKESPIATTGADERDPIFSENGRFMAFVRTGNPDPGLYVLPVPETGAPDPKNATRLATGTQIGGLTWSPDSRWLAFSRRDRSSTVDIWVVPTFGGEPINITRYPGINGQPAWTRDGKKLVFLSSRSSGDSSGNARNLYSVDLLTQPDEARPSNRPPGPMADDAPELLQRQRPTGPPQGAQQPMPPSLPGLMVAPRANLVQIEFDGIEDRAKPVTNFRDSIASYALSPDSRTVLFTAAVGGQLSWNVADLQAGSLIRIAPTTDAGTGLHWAENGGAAYFIGARGTLQVMPRGAPAAAPIAFRAFMTVDRRAELAEAFNQAWRELRTQFYDPQMHGVNWQALQLKYYPLLNEIETKEDFSFLLQSMIGELNASHMGATPPPDEAPGAVTGYLGLEFDPTYDGPGLRISKVLKGGPASHVGSTLSPGEYLLAVDGQDVSATESYGKALQDTIGRTIDVVVGAKPTKDTARTVRVKPISKAAQDDLTYNTWVNERRAIVDRQSGGALAYVHIRAMDQPSLSRFERELFGLAQSKLGLVVDVRFNGGGRIHDDLLALLVRKPHAYETPRDGEKSTQPFKAWARPSILLINEFSASDAEIFPNGFRQNGLGKVVGMPTAGAVIGTTNITLVDGTVFRIPRTGWTTIDGKPLENVGVQPDIRIDYTPEDVATGRDPQLETAVRELLKQMADHPVP